MTSRRGEGTPPSARGGSGPRVATIVPSSGAPEHPILSAIRSNDLLDQIRHSDSALQVRRTTRLVGDLAAITPTLTMSFSDLLFRCMSGESAERLQRRFPKLCRRSTSSILCVRSPWCCVSGVSRRSTATSPHGCLEPTPASLAYRCVLRTLKIFSKLCLSRLLLKMRRPF